ncbi:MAG: hypothetical protein IH621_14195 [Krumholzibacteria bacterium]|nr:hypothetical protein [Candidatus Krumholzibacteria bacterium]
MKCPFLQTKSVKYCGLCRLTMIPLDGDGRTPEPCSGPGYEACPLLAAHHDGPLPQDQCPHLHFGDVHCCAASAVQKQIPCSRTAVSRCTDEGHRHCPLYLAMAEPGRGGDDGDGDGGDDGRDDGDLPVPDTLAFAPNHLWLDHRGGRTCHIGVDAFFGRALGRVDEIHFPFDRGDGRPAVRIRAAGVDFDLVFPNRVEAVEANPHLAVAPRDILCDPYGRGWLFEGIVSGPSAAGGRHPLHRGLRRGAEARRWMRREHERLALFVHDRLLDTSDAATPLLQDGGFPRLPLADVLPAGALVRLHTEFFSHHTGRADP